MQTLGENQFSFGLFSDPTKWNAWVQSVQNDRDAISPAKAIAQKSAVSKFSDYVIKVECETTNDLDGCCMFSVDPLLGGWCLF